MVRQSPWANLSSCTVLASASAAHGAGLAGRDMLGGCTAEALKANLAVQAGSALSAGVINRVAKELRELQTKPEEGIKARACLRAVLVWHALRLYNLAPMTLRCPLRRCPSMRRTSAKLRRSMMGQVCRVQFLGFPVCNLEIAAPVAGQLATHC